MANEASFDIPKQTYYVYDKDMGKYLYFDGVTKLQHTLSLKMEDDPDNIKGDNYVYNAQNEPNELAFDVYMSNVYTTKNDLTGSGEDRCKSAYEYLVDLKKARRKCEVVTTMMTYTDMLLKSIVVTQDDTLTFGWMATITFRESVASKGGGGRTNNTSNSKVTGDSGGDPPGLLVQWLGPNYC